MQSSRNGRPPWLLCYRSSTVFIVATVWISSFTDYFLYAMVVPILPTALSERANVPYKDREYWVSVLLMSEALTAFLCCPIFGYIVDKTPTRRAPYVLGLLFLGASMGLLAVARSPAVFVLARLLQGGATAMVAVAGLALLTDSVPLDNLGQTIGYQGSAVALGFMLGPLLGGIVYCRAGYGVVIGMAFALVGVDLLMRLLVIEKGVAERWVVKEDEDLEGVEGVEAILDARVRGGYRTFADVVRSGDDESQVAVTNGHTEHREQEQRPRGHRAPTILQIARHRRVVISSFGLLVQGLLYSAFDATIPIFVENTFNWSPLGAGLAFLPSALTALLEPFFGYISDTYGPRLPTFTSFFLLPLPLAAMSIASQNKTTHIALLLTLLTVSGLLMNLATPALYVETQNVLESLQNQAETQEETYQDEGQNQNRNQNLGHQSSPIVDKRRKTAGIAQAFGIQTMAQFLGMFLGSLWGGFVEWRFGWKAMCFSLAGLCFVSCWGMLGLGKEEIGKGKGKKQGSSGDLFGIGEWVKGRLLGRKDGGGDGEREREGEREGLLDRSEE
ncbi:major facilitator superfamily domain-containing protein [Aspergillus karnatakaensis]|uniref:MFS transporter n=1 Tax=Aspergillus karnatakaensis TaxID=1810916 RepID=UPI003CCD8264